jgi:oligoribonuclease
MVPRSDYFIWLDLEMTGLDPDQDRILEIATVITDPNLQVIAEGPVFAIHQSETLILNMDEWNTNQHNKSGLIERVRASQLNEKQAEELTLAFLSKFVVAGKSPMCGNSICQDRRFISKRMPELANFFHYRNLDVTSIKILAQSWNPRILSNFSKESTHLALQDIHDSIAELKFYRQHFFRVEGVGK